MTGASIIAMAIIPGLRLACLMLWGLIVVYDIDALWRRVRRKPEGLDRIRSNLALVGIAVMTFQVRSLSGAVLPNDDWWTTFALALLLIAAIGYKLYIASTLSAAERTRFLRSRALIVIACLLFGIVV